MRTSLAAEVEVLATQLDRIAQLDRHTADFTRASMREAIVETIARFPVYRTYVSERGVTIGGSTHRAMGDQRCTREQSAAARCRSTIFCATCCWAMLRQDRPESHARAMLEFAMKFQQVTAPVTAKGVEDTAFYRYNRLISVNEVGGDPRRFAFSTRRRASGKPGARADLAAFDAGDFDARYEAQRRCARTHRRVERVAGAVAAASCALESA